MSRGHTRGQGSRPVQWPLPVFALFRLPPMSLYSISNAQLAFGHVALLDHADFSLEAGERVGLIGRTGAGKSSLLKIIAGLHKPDDGLITRQNELTTVYVPQEPEFDLEASVFDVVASGLTHARELLDDYHRVAHA